MAEDDDRALRRALEVALEAADAADDTLIAAKLADCLWLLSRRTDDIVGGITTSRQSPVPPRRDPRPR